MASELYKERQQDELQVLQSIYMHDFNDLRTKDAWKVSVIILYYFAFSLLKVT